MLARVPIISAYDPSRESMLAYASSSYETAIVITGLVINFLGTNNCNSDYRSSYQVHMIQVENVSGEGLSFVDRESL